MKKVYMFLAVISLLVACKKQVLEPLPYAAKNAPQVDSSKVYQLPVTDDEKLLVLNLNRTSEVFRKLYQHPSNIKIVLAAIESGAYTDESVLLADLIYPNEGFIHDNDRFLETIQTLKLSPQAFASAFWLEASKMPSEYHEFLAGERVFLSKLKSPNVVDVGQGGISNDGGAGFGASIYFPYSQNFPPVSEIDRGEEAYGPIIAIQTATAEADEGIGTLPVYVNGLLVRYESVLVNDQYCFDHPTHIIGVNGIEPYGGPDEPGTPPPPPAPPPSINRVYTGDFIAKRNKDPLISASSNGGGSEFRICRISAYLQSNNGQVTNFQGDVIEKNVSRWQIWWKKEHRLNSVWDDDWASGDLEQVFAIYEEDNVETQTINGSITSTLNLSGNSVVATVGYNVVVQSQDDILIQQKFSRLSYFRDAFNDQGHGFSGNYTFLQTPFVHGWPWYNASKRSGGDFGYTLIYKVN